MTGLHLVMVAGVALIGFWMIGAHNRLVRLRGAIGAGWPAVAAQLRERHTLAAQWVDAVAPLDALADTAGRAMVEMASAATQQARAALDHADARSSNAGAIQSLGLAEQVLDGALRPLRLLVEAREVHDEHVLALMVALQHVEPQILFTRRMFNRTVQAFNAAIDEWPTRVVAGGFGFRAAAVLQSVSPDAGPESQFGSTVGDRLP